MKHKLQFLDGIRGIASLYVVFCHARNFCPGAGAASLHSKLGIARVFLTPFCLGHYAVGVFIVLSGFLLMLPVASSGTLKGGAGGFLMRRARRIMPPYYAALLLFSGAFLIPFFRTPLMDFQLPLTLVNFLAHVFFIHNLSDDWSQRIDGSMWTVATEMQIYLLFPLLLLPLYRRVGIFVTALIALAIGVALHYLHPLQYAAPWYLGLFATGMAGAVIYSEERFAAVRKSFPFGMVAMIGGAVLLLLLLKYREANVSFLWALDAALGVIITCLIVHLAMHGGRLRSFLESPPLEILSKFSYSLYLFHLPIIIWIAGLASYTLHLSEIGQVLWTMGIATPLTILFCYGAYWLVERHFTTPLQSSKPAVPPSEAAVPSA